MTFAAKRPRAVLAGLFVASGFVSLVAEQVFEKLLGLLLGTSTPAAAVVLGVYFAGLTLGAAGYARLLRPRVRSALRAYAFLEGGVAVWCLLWALLFDRLIPAFSLVLTPGADVPWLLQLLRFGVACLWILPPTTLMGATFPAIADALESLRAPDGSRALARFYAANLLGGLAAALLAPYAVFPHLGMDGTLVACFLLDGGVSTVALLLASRAGGGAPAEAAAPFPEARRARLLLAVAALSGFLFFTLEVLWTQLIGAVLGNSVYAFAAMLSVVLAGLAIGGAVMGLLVRGDRPLSGAVPAALFLLGAVALAVTHGMWPGTANALAAQGARLTSFYGGEALRLLRAAILLLPAATLLGMAYPSLFRLALFPPREWAAFVGRMSAVNTIGCVAGALVAAFWLIPRVGSEAGMLLVIGLYAVVGFGVGMALVRGPGRVFLLAGALVALLAGATRPPWDQLALTSGQHVYFARTFVVPGSRLRFLHEDAAGGITTVVENGTGSRATRVLLTNGKFQGNDGGEVRAQTGFALAPVLSVRRLDRALVIGLGTGQTAQVVSTLGFREEDVVEIAPGIVEAARTEFPHLLKGVLDRPGTRLRLEDGRNFLLLHDRRYDLVTMEISSIWFAGATNLYSREFYELVRTRLAPGGVFQQWIQLHHIGFGELASVVATVRSAFPCVSVWILGGQGILVASEGPQELTGAGYRAVTDHASLLGWRAGEEADRLVEILAGRVLSPEDTDAFLRHVAARVNTDRNRWLEFATPRYNLSRVTWNVVNAATFAVFAGPPRFRSGPGAPPEAGTLAARVTPALRLRQLGLDEALVERTRASILRSSAARHAPR